MHLFNKYRKVLANFFFEDKKKENVGGTRQVHKLLRCHVCLRMLVKERRFTLETRNDNEAISILHNYSKTSNQTYSITAQQIVPD